MRKIKCRKCGKIVEATGAQVLCPACRKEARHKSLIAPRTCRACGKVFPGGPRAWYCPDCRLERRREADKRSKQRKAAGRARSIGSTGLCEICGKPYIVNGSLQRYCPDCAKAATDAVARRQKRAYAASHRAEYAARKADYTRSRRVCSVCGSSFYAPTPRVTCSDRCARILRSYSQAHADHLRRGSPEPTMDDVAARLDRASGVKGVSRSKNGKRWVARADNKHLGTFDTIEQAQEAIDRYLSQKIPRFLDFLLDFRAKIKYNKIIKERGKSPGKDKTMKINELSIFEIDDFEIRRPVPVSVSGKDYVAFLQHSRAEDGYGWYYTSYDADNGEGCGWFGSETEPAYYFEDAVVNGELRQRTLGVGQGCFWTDWR